MDKEPYKDIRSTLAAITPNADYRTKFVALLKRMEKDGLIKPVAKQKESAQHGYIWKSDIYIYSIAYWVISIETQLGMLPSKITWKPFEHLFNIKRGTLKQAKQKLPSKIHRYPYFEQIDKLKKYAVITDANITPKSASNNTRYSFEDCAEELTKDIWEQYLICEYLEKLEADGWIRQTENGYKWNKGTTKQLIAYWIDQISINLRLSKIYGGANEQNKTLWKPFERLFNIKYGSLRVIKANWLQKNKGEFKPNGWREIEKYTKQKECPDKKKWRKLQKEYKRFLSKLKLAEVEALEQPRTMSE